MTEPWHGCGGLRHFLVGDRRTRPAWRDRFGHYGSTYFDLFAAKMLQLFGNQRRAEWPADAGHAGANCIAKATGVAEASFRVTIKRSLDRCRHRFGNGRTQLAQIGNRILQDRFEGQKLGFAPEKRPAGGHLERDDSE